MKVIRAINFPVAILDDGSGIPVSEIMGSPREGCQIEQDENGIWTVKGNNADPDCVGGVCPIK